jgi:hypothetical protein
MSPATALKGAVADARPLQTPGGALALTESLTH